MLGNAHLLDVATEIRSRPSKERFYARQLAAATGLADPVVHPCLHRLAAAGVVDEVDGVDRQRLFVRHDHPFWKFIAELDRLHHDT